MNELQIFSNPEFGEVRTINVDGDVWFVGIDVARALGYQKPLEAVNTNVDKEDTAIMGVSDANNHTQQTKCITESGLYSLIFGSKLDGAKKFKHWVTSDVLPAIRKTGHYEMVSVPAPAPMTQLEILSGAIDSLMQHEKQLAALTEAQAESNKRLDTVEQKIIQAADVFTAPSYNYDTWRMQANDAINELLDKNGLPQSVYRGQLYKKLENIAGVSLTHRQTRLRNRMKREGATRTQQNAVTKLVVVARDKKLRAIFDGILREERAKNIMAG